MLPSRATQIRNSIKALFPDRDCFTLVRPMHDERALNRLNEVNPEQLRPEFQQVRRGGGGLQTCRRAACPAACSVSNT